jgi:hypothetical protein
MIPPPVAAALRTCPDPAPLWRVDLGLAAEAPYVMLLAEKRARRGFELLSLADGFERADDPDEVGDRARQAVKPRDEDWEIQR